MTAFKYTGAFLLMCGVLSGQTAAKPDENTARMAAGEKPIFRAEVTAKTAKAINYRHRSGATKIDFQGTSLLPGSHGEAKVEGKQGYIEIEVEFRALQAANKFGTEYLTYVLWAITPEGRTSNLGEILLNGTSSKLNVTTELQAFALVVTAEPYFAVTMPSDLIVMENVVRKDTLGKIEEVDARYELLQRGQYSKMTNPLTLRLDPKQPLELYEARNAVQIARASGADKFATETMQKAEKSLEQAEAYQKRKAGKKPVAMTARESVQTAEDARVIAVKRQQEAALASEREASAAREARAETAKANAQAETDRVNREAEAARLSAKAEAQRLTREKEAQQMAAKAEADRLKAENDARMATANAEADRARAVNEARLMADKAEAERLKAENDRQLAANTAALDKAAKDKAQLEAEKVELRASLLKQFNLILQTRDTARGLIVNMSDVLFDTGKYTLRGAAREKLARVAGVISGHPGLRLDVE